MAGRGPWRGKRGTILDFLTSILLQKNSKYQKLKRPFGGKTLKKSLNAKKPERGDPLVSPGIVCYAEKKEQLLYFSSLCEMVQVDNLKIRRTILVSSCGLNKSLLQWRFVSPHEAPTKEGPIKKTTNTLILKKTLNSL